MPNYRRSNFRMFFITYLLLTAAQLHLFVLMSKTREILNVLNLAYKMEYLLRVNDASEPDWAVLGRLGIKSI